MTGFPDLASRDVNSSRLSTCPHVMSSSSGRRRYVHHLCTSTTSLSVHHLMDIWVCLTFWLICTGASMNMVCSSFCVNMFPVLRGTHLEVGLLGYRVMPYLAFWGTAAFFQCQQQGMMAPISPHPYQHFYFPFLSFNFIIAIPGMWSTISLWFWFALP